MKNPSTSPCIASSIELTMLSTLIPDLEALIFSYISEVPDILRLIRLNKYYRYKIPLLITHLTWKRHCPRMACTYPCVPFHFLITLHNLAYSKIPVILQSKGEIITVARMRNLQQIALIIDEETCPYDTFPGDENNGTLTAYPYAQVKFFLQYAANKQISFDLLSSSDIKFSPIQYEGCDVDVYIGPDSVYLHDYVRDHNRDHLSLLLLIAKTRPIHHFTTTIIMKVDLEDEFFNEPLFRSLESVSVCSLDRYAEWIYLLKLAFNTATLTSFDTYDYYWQLEVRYDENDVVERLLNDKSLKIIERPFEILVPVYLPYIEVCLHFFPKLKSIAIIIDYELFDIVEYCSVLRTKLFPRNIQCEVYGTELTLKRLKRALGSEDASKPLYYSPPPYRFEYYGIDQ